MMNTNHRQTNGYSFVKDQQVGNMLKHDVRLSNTAIKGMLCYGRFLKAIAGIA